MKSIEIRTFRGTLLGFVSFFISIIHSILLVPFFLNYWGEAKYGQFLAIYAFIQLLRTLDSGHQVFVGNAFNLHFHQDQEKAQKTLSSSILIALLIGFFELMLFVIFWKTGLADKLLGLNIKLDTGLFFGIISMLVMWWIVGSVGGILVRAIMAKGLFSEATLFAILIKILETVLLGFAIVLKASLAQLFGLLAIVNFAFSVLVLYWIHKSMPEIYPWWKGWSLRTGISNLGKSVVFTINGFLEQLNTNGLIFMVSHYLSIAMIPVFTTLRTLSNTMNMVTNIFIQPLIPEMVRLHSQDRKIQVIKVIQANWFFSGILVNVGFLLLIPVAETLYGLWTNHKLVFNEELFYLLILSVAIYNYGRAIASYLTGINDLKATSTITWAKSLILFGVCFILIKPVGILAIGIGVLLSEIVGSVFLPNYFVMTHLANEWKVQKSLMVYAIPVITMSLVILLLFIFREWKYIISLIGLLSVLYVYYLQWKELDNEIKEKVTRLSKRYIPNKLS